MSNSPNPGNLPEPTPENTPEPTVSRGFWQRLLRPVFMLMVMILVSGIGGGSLFAWYFIQKQLAPTVEKNLSSFLNRKVNVGPVEGFSLNGVRFGSSEIPATPTDPDHLVTEAVKVTYNPVKLLFTRTLELDVTLVEPNIYVEQDKDLTWVSTAFTQTAQDSAFKVDPKVVRWRDADVVVVPRSEVGIKQPPMRFTEVRGKSKFIDGGQLIRFDVNSQPLTGGNLKVKGDYRLSQEETDLHLDVDNVSAAEVSKVLLIPLKLQGGKLGGNLRIQRNNAEQPWQYWGTINFSDTIARLEPLPQLFTESKGKLSFRGSQIWLNNITTRFGQVPAQIGGMLDIESGYKLRVKSEPVEIQQYAQTFGIKQLPVNTLGKAQATFEVTGAIDNPIVIGEAFTTTPATLDQVKFSSITADFSVINTELAIRNLQATPTVGGLVTGKGDIKFMDQGGAVFDLKAVNVPADAIAKQYGFNLPIPLGRVYGRTQIFSPLDKPENFRATGYANLPMGDGILRATNFQVGGGRWQGLVEAKNISVAPIIKTLPAPSLPPQFSGPFNGQFNLSGRLDSFQPETLRASGYGSVTVDGGTLRATKVKLINGGFSTLVQASDIPLEALAPVPSEFKGPISGELTISGNVLSLSPSTITASGSGSLDLAAGTIKADAIAIAKGKFQAQVVASNLKLGRLAPIPPQFNGPASGEFTISGNVDSVSPSTITASGSGSLDVAGGTIKADAVDIANGNFQAQVVASNLQLGRLGPIPPQFDGPASGEFTISGNVDSVSPSTITASGSGSLDLAGGTIKADAVDIAKGNFKAQVVASNLQLGRLGPIPSQFDGPASGEFTISGNLDSVSPSTITASGSGTLDVVGGRIQASQIDIANGNFQAKVQTSKLDLGALAPVPPQFNGPLSGNVTVSGNLSNLTIDAIQGKGSGQLNVAGGQLLATAEFSNGKFQGVFQPTNLQLWEINPDLRGRLNGSVNIDGPLLLTPDTALSAIQAKGKLNFSEGISILERSLATSFDWNGQRLEIKEATAEGFNANGFVNLNPGSQGLQAIKTFDFQVQAEDLNLQRLPADLPYAFNLGGLVGFNGRIAGTPKAPTINGDLRLRYFFAGPLEFESLLTGRVSIAPKSGVNLQLAGNQDKLEVVLDPNYQPVSFLVQYQNKTATGIRSGDELQMTVENFPINTIKSLALSSGMVDGQNLEPWLSKPLAGDISGNMALNLKTFGSSGEIAIANPIFDNLRGKRLQGFFQYQQGTITLTDGLFQKGDSQYLFAANVTPTPNGPEFNGELQAKLGEIQDVLTTLQLFEITDLGRGFQTPVYGTAADLAVTGVGNPQNKLKKPLRRMSEIVTLLNRQRQQRQESLLLPELTEMNGSFTGSISMVGSVKDGIRAQFNFQGENWQWGSYKAETIIAQGNFEEGVLNLLPVRIQSGQSLATLSGSIGEQGPSGQLRLKNVPVSLIRQLFKFPASVGYGGFVDATADFYGSLSNPQARGAISVVDASLNRTPLESIKGSFSYNNARLNVFAQSFLTKESEPLTVNAKIPYKLPFAEVEPENRQVSVQLKVENEGLARLNMLTNQQIAWVDGRGQVDLDISGTFDQDQDWREQLEQLTVIGNINVENATIAAQALPEPLTEVNGKIRFNFNRMEIVDTLQGNFGGGKLVAVGNLPLQDLARALENPLTVDLNQLAINLKGIYSGGVQGQTIITGTLFNPRIGGYIELFDGQVPISESQTAPIGSSGSAGDELIEFNNLQLTLGKNILVRQLPVLDFLASGTLLINGDMSDIRPEGTIQLLRGQVNLFTTQFRLDKNYNNNARFVAALGRDPELDVQMVASVIESRKQPITSETFANEISDRPTNFGSTETIRVQAKVKGLASQLFDRVELNSMPKRSEGEIVALLGGGFVDTLGRGNTTLGLANLAGSALLSNVSNLIGDAAGLDEFRIFPTTVTDDNRRTDSLELGAEAGINITNNLSFSLLKVLTTDQPIQYNLRYRVNEEILLRGATNFSDDTKITVEYENRF
ncbi:translocation/assembly module TamB domain-containing protein [Moorena producens JHB]|uniref:Translocation/assembly module TamB domain-containing protein n=1 Tax=Moorena producens (strain JHB) TaxID=1454205 RepID=A0A1D9G8Y4_MOOP1|nr:translocation/assembly module TamB [Moorena producens]AOY84021.1 translocation/assembly module TamB domain-containing protein [Moorena producens JHB]